MLISFEGHKDSVPAPANRVLGACSQHCGLCPQEAEALLGDNNLGAFNTLTNAHPQRNYQSTLCAPTAYLPRIVLS